MLRGIGAVGITSSAIIKISINENTTEVATAVVIEMFRRKKPAALT